MQCLVACALHRQCLAVLTPERALAHKHACVRLNTFLPNPLDLRPFTRKHTQMPRGRKSPKMNVRILLVLRGMRDCLREQGKKQLRRRKHSLSQWPEITTTLMPYAYFVGSQKTHFIFLGRDSRATRVFRSKVVIL